MSEEQERDIDIPDESGKTDEETNEIEEFDHGTPLDPRAELMNQMVVNSKEEREKSHQEYLEANGLEADEDPLDADDDEVVEEELEEVVDKSVENSDNKIVERDGEQYLKLNVNGEEREVPLDEAIANLQKNENADVRTQEVVDLAKQYKDLIAQAEQQQTEFTPPDDEDAVDTQEVLNKALNKVYDGDIEDAAAELAAILGKTPSPQPKDVRPTKQEIAEVVVELEDHRTLKQAFKRFQENEEFEAITQDSDLMDRVNSFTEDLQKDPEFLKTNPTYDDYFNEAAKRTDEWVKKISGTSILKKPSQDIDEDERLTRKRQAKTPPSPRTVRRGRKKDENPFAKSNKDVIRELAKQRGQTNL